MPRKKKPRICSNCIFGQMRLAPSDYTRKLYNTENPDLRVCRKLTDASCVLFEARAVFHPETFQQSAGIVLYYDNMNWLFFRIYWSETLGRPALGILHTENGKKTEYPEYRFPAPDTPYLRLNIQDNRTWFSWSEDHENWNDFGPVFPTDHFSDEYSEYGEFTGSFAGLAAVDALTHSKEALFDCVCYKTADSAGP